MSQVIAVLQTLATLENLRRIDGSGGRFVSVMPKTWKEDRLFRQAVKQGQVQWISDEEPDSSVIFDLLT